jgi:REP element-mobilizing transposase RayT
MATAVKTHLHPGNSEPEPAAESFRPGSTPVSGVGETVPVSRTFETEDANYTKRRLPHFEKPWTIYAVTMSTRGHRTLSPAGRTIVLNAFLHFHLNRYELIAACVMPDHVHLLLQPWPKTRNEKANAVFWRISDLSHSWKSFTAHEINKLERTNGPLWEEEVFDRYIRSESDLAEKFRYICHNPWEARIVNSKDGYHWLWTWHDDPNPGSTPVSGVGFGVSPKHSSKVRESETLSPTPETGVLPGTPRSAERSR